VKRTQPAYERLHAEFRWRVPGDFNIADVCCTRWARDTPDAVAHRASVTQHAVMSGPGGFPKPLDPPKSAWWQARTVQGAAAAAVVVAAAVLVILAVTGAFGTHHDQLSALSHGTSSAGAGPGSSGGTASASPPGGPGGAGAPGSSDSPGSIGARLDAELYVQERSQEDCAAVTCPSATRPSRRSR